MFHAPPPESPPRFDPLLGRSPPRHVRSGEIRPEQLTPRFIAFGGRRSSVSGWRDAFRIALRAARQEVPTLGALSQLCGVELRPGRGHPNATYDRELDASVPALPTSRNAQALFRLMDGLGQSVRVRASGPAGDLLIEHRPEPRPAPSPERAAPVSLDLLIRAAERGEAAFGSFVEISVEGLFEKRVFRLGAAGSDPRRGELSASSPVGRALLGLTPGAETGYAAGPASRRILLHAVDNRHVLRALTGQDPPRPE